MKKLERFLGKGFADIEVEAKDGTKETVRINCVAVNDFPLFFELMKGGLDTDKLDQKKGEVLVEIVKRTLKKSFPEEDDTTLDDFAARHFIKIVNAIMEANFETTVEKKSLSP